MSKTTFIYALCEPGTRTIRYIGKSNDPETRLRYGHLLDSVKLTTHLGRWLQRVLRESLTPSLVILAEVSKQSWKMEEQRYIANARMLGMDLVNSTDGGEGVTMTPEIRKKIGDANRGKPCSKAQRKQISKTLMGRKLPEAQKKAISEGVTGTRRTDEQRNHYRLSKLGKKNPMFGKTGKLHHAFGKTKQKTVEIFQPAV